MKHGFRTTSCVARAMLRDTGAARFRGKTGEGEVSTKAIESILAHSGEPILRETSAAGARRRILQISHHSDPRWRKKACSMQTTAVQHLTNALFLSEPVEPPLPSLGQSVRRRHTVKAIRSVEPILDEHR